MRQGIFGEIYQPKVQIDAYRRNLQRAYLDLMSTRINGNAAIADDQRPMYRGELRKISADAVIALPKTTDRATRLHLEDVRDQIARMLDPKFIAPTPQLQQLQPQPLSFEDEFFQGSLVKPGDEFCWTDYAVVADHNR
jgi:hypothetical protein